MITMVINHLLSGMILQANPSLPSHPIWPEEEILRLYKWGENGWNGVKKNPTSRVISPQLLYLSIRAIYKGLGCF